MKFSGKMCVMIILKVAKKKTGLHSFSEKPICGKTLLRAKGGLEIFSK